MKRLEMLSSSTGNSLMSQAIYGLANSFAVLSAGSTGGLTIEQIMNPSEDVNTNNLNSSFQMYLQQNFASID